jgi:hypothetical protein
MPAVQFCEETHQHCKIWLCRYVASSLEFAFSGEVDSQMNQIWKNCFSKEYEIESFCFQNDFDGNKSLANEIGRNHGLFGEIVV